MEPVLNRVAESPFRIRLPLKRRRVVKHVVRVSTIVARASFWAVCVHYFGAEVLLSAVAAWAFLIGAKDLTFARVRLANMTRPSKRRSAIAKSIALELFILVLRLLVLLLIVRILEPLDGAVSAIVAGLMLCVPFWARETMATFARVRRVKWSSRYVTLASALTGLGAVVVFAHAEVDPLTATVIALVLREAVTFFGFAAAILPVGMSVSPAKAARDDEDEEDEEDEDEDDDGGKAITAIGPDGKPIRSTFKIFLADNIVHARWKISQLGTRVVAHGLLGPFGNIGTRLVYAYRRPAPYVHGAKVLPVRKMVAMGVAAAAVIAIGGYLAGGEGLLNEYGIAVGAVAFRASAVSLNLLLWQRLSGLIGSDVKPRLGRWRRRPAGTTSMDEGQEPPPTG